MTGTHPSWHKVLGLMTVVSGRRIKPFPENKARECLDSISRFAVEESRPYGMIAILAESREDGDRK